MATPRDRTGASDTAATEILPGRRSIDSTIETTEPDAETAVGSPAAADRARRVRESAGMMAALLPGSGSGAPSSSTGAALEGKLGSAVDALHQDEIRRSRLLAQFGIVLALAVVAALLVLP